MSFDVLLTATTARDRQLSLDLGKQLQQGGASLGELWRIPVDAVGQHRHARSLCGLRRWPCNHGPGTMFLEPCRGAAGLPREREEVDVRLCVGLAGLVSPRQR